ncbi:larval cuticle protein A2B-like [Teleopsis dalmanni]|uniref:larval cuticle protein A2B-like n=1 Tax=Teleopsis dalmanni TaxID=139649 RepID=UPI0018CDA84A|nr:larval cuticle protein A2B-like [Teleopsis dalmanni]XP_037958990.1 larval cuticle protein A2B-like [Teleopsis dalmanni]XP_037959423.1 larval cuticle protein A2B-like [Teleopsis dalmanni]
MSWKVLALLICIVVVASAQHHYSYSHGHGHDDHHEDEHDHGPAHYEFHYSVKDPKTKDIKSQKESRKDHKVEGYYELIDSDGHHRIVHYKADKKTGFEATVERKPTKIKVPIPKITYEHHEDHHDHHENHNDHHHYYSH